MYIKQLSLENYRNYAKMSLHFKHGLTILTGENAQGKTNLLEAIFLLSLAKSHRTNHDQEMIYWEHDFALIQAEVVTQHYTIPLELQLNAKGKIAKVNHIEQSKLSHFIGKLNVILFAPEDLQMIKGAPNLRRKFIDAELGQAFPVYLQALLNYQRVLKQRNKYLKETAFKGFDAIYFDVLTEQLISFAVTIIRHRREFIQHLEKIAQPIHTLLSNDRDSLTLDYLSHSQQLHYQDIDTLSDQLFKYYQTHLSKERERKVTLFGPHKDDLGIYLNGKPAQFFGSQGQQRTIVLSLKLAEIEILHELTGEYPVLLLDDVLSELDDQRKHLLMSHIENKVQTFLTTASLEGLDLDVFKQADILHVHQGHITRKD